MQTNDSSPSNPPSTAKTGDIWMEVDADDINFYVYDGNDWIGVTPSDQLDPLLGSDAPVVAPTPPETPEQAYDRAMGVLK